MESVWIVGASTGIGKALAIEYYHLGYRVFISARSGQALTALSQAYEPNADSQGMMIPVVMDVTQDAAIVTAIDEITKITPLLHKVIINAGTCEYVDHTLIDLQLMDRVLDTNLLGAVKVSNQVQPLLNHQQHPQMAFVSSSVTYQALPRAHAYGASKAALRYFVECLKMDIQHKGIDVRIISPGFVQTPLTDKNDFNMPFMISSEEASKRIIKGLNSGTFDIQFPKRFTWSLKLFSLLPDVIKFKLLGKLTIAEDDKTSGVPS